MSSYLCSLRRAWVVLVLVGIPLLPPILSQAGSLAESAKELFQEGVKAFQEKDFEQARAKFIKSLRIRGPNSVTLYNLGLAEAREGRAGAALATWRKALVLDPRNSAVREAIEWNSKKLEKPMMAQKVHLWEEFRSSLLQKFTLFQCLVFVSTLGFASAVQLLRYFGQRRRALLDERPLPALSVGTIVLALVLFSSAGITLAKAYDANIVRATVLAKKIEVRSTPSTDGTVLFDLYEGLEVIVGQRVQDWTQVTYPGGATGWVPQSQIFTTDDEVAL